MTQLNNFIAKLKSDGVAKTNKFTVVLDTPSSVFGSYDMQSMLMYCSSANLPGINFASIPARIHGETFEFPYEKIYSPVQLTFYVDTNMEIKKFFDDWHASIQNPDTKEFEYYKNYTSNIQIFVQNSKDNEVYSVNLFEAYPKTVNDIQLDFNSSNQIMMLNVTMTYRFYKTAQQTGIVDNAGLNSALFENFSPSNLVSGNIPFNYLKDFSGFQADLQNQFVNTIKTSEPVTNAKAALSSFISKSKIVNV